MAKRGEYVQMINDNEAIYPTKENLILALLEILGDSTCSKRAHELIDDIYSFKRSDNPALNELRLLRISMVLIDYGARILASSTMQNELKIVIGELVSAISNLDISGMIRSTQQAEYAANMVEVAITDNWLILPPDVRDLDSVKQLVSAAKKSLDRMAVYDDMGGPILLLSDEELAKLGILNNNLPYGEK